MTASPAAAVENPFAAEFRKAIDLPLQKKDYGAVDKLADDLVRQTKPDTEERRAVFTVVNDVRTDLVQKSEIRAAENFACFQLHRGSCDAPGHDEAWDFLTMRRKDYFNSGKIVEAGNWAKFQAGRERTDKQGKEITGFLMTLRDHHVAQGADDAADDIAQSQYHYYRKKDKPAGRKEAWHFMQGTARKNLQSGKMQKVAERIEFMWLYSAAGSEEKRESIAMRAEIARDLFDKNKAKQAQDWISSYGTYAGYFNRDDKKNPEFRPFEKSAEIEELNHRINAEVSQIWAIADIKTACGRFAAMHGGSTPHSEAIGATLVVQSVMAGTNAKSPSPFQEALQEEIANGFAVVLAQDKPEDIIGLSQAFLRSNSETHAVALDMVMQAGAWLLSNGKVAAAENLGKSHYAGSFYDNHYPAMARRDASWNLLDRCRHRHFANGDIKAGKELTRWQIGYADHKSQKKSVLDSLGPQRDVYKAADRATYGDFIKFQYGIAYTHEEYDAELLDAARDFVTLSLAQDDPGAAADFLLWQHDETQKDGKLREQAKGMGVALAQYHLDKGELDQAREWTDWQLKANAHDYRPQNLDEARKLAGTIQSKISFKKTLADFKAQYPGANAVAASSGQSPELTPPMP